MKAKTPLKSQPKIHDSGYKKLFSNRTIFQQLIETFITEAWVKDLDFSKCETLDKSFITDHYKETESDLIYKLKLRRKTIYIYVLMEFQSKVDRFMVRGYCSISSAFIWITLRTISVSKSYRQFFPLCYITANASGAHQSASAI